MAKVGERGGCSHSVRIINHTMPDGRVATICAACGKFWPDMQKMSAEQRLQQGVTNATLDITRMNTNPALSYSDYTTVAELANEMAYRSGQTIDKLISGVPCLIVQKTTIVAIDPRPRRFIWDA